jgi:hypothetical protein
VAIAELARTELSYQGVKWHLRTTYFWSKGDRVWPVQGQRCKGLLRAEYWTTALTDDCWGAVVALQLGSQARAGINRPWLESIRPFGWGLEGVPGIQRLAIATPGRLVISHYIECQH